MNKTIEISLPYHFCNADINEFNNMKVGPYKFCAEKQQKPEKEMGGMGWPGIIIILSVAIATGFLEELGKDVYNSIKNKLFKKKQKLKKKDKEKFTINIKLDSQYGIAAFDLTDLDENQFNKSLDKIIEALKLIPKNNDEIIYYKYAGKIDQWEIDEILNY